MKALNFKIELEMASYAIRQDFRTQKTSMDPCPGCPGSLGHSEILKIFKLVKFFKSFQILSIFHTFILDRFRLHLSREPLIVVVYHG